MKLKDIKAYEKDHRFLDNFKRNNKLKNFPETIQLVVTKLKEMGLK